MMVAMPEGNFLVLAFLTGDGGASLPVWWKAILYAGKFHPPIIHFPVALILVAALLEMVAWLKPRAALSERLAVAAAINLFGGAAGALVAAALGWALAAGMGFEPELKPALFWHRWIGTATALVACVTVGAWFWRRRTGTTSTRLTFRLLLLLTAASVGVVGFLGGVLVYGWDHYQR